MNRCQRGWDAGESNADHLAKYILDVRELLNGVGDSAADSAQLIVYSQMLPDTAHGLDPGYQLQWGGRYGAMAAGSGQLASLASGHANAIFPVGFPIFEQVRLTEGWPSPAYLPDVSVIGWMIDDQPGTHLAPYQYPDTSANPTWYESDARGFLAASEYYEDHAQTEDELRLLDYAWKRHRHPDATLHARVDGIYITDDVAGMTVRPLPLETVEFEPFGSAEVRDPAFDEETITLATIDWGDGSPPDTVTSLLNVGTVSHSWPCGSHDVTLCVESGSASRTVTIPVEVDTDDPSVTKWDGSFTLGEGFTVAEETILMIEAGTNLTITSDTARIWVDGILVICGTESGPVGIAYDDTTQTDGWPGIFVDETGTAVIEHCRYRNALGGIGVRGSLTIRHSTIEDCKGSGLVIGASDSSYAYDLVIRDIASGITSPLGINLTENAKLRLEGSLVDSLWYGAQVYGAATMYAEGCTFRNNVTIGVLAYSQGSLIADDCVFDGGSLGLVVQDTAHAVVTGASVFKNARYYGASVYGSGELSLTGTTFEDDSTGFYAAGGGTVNVDGCVFEDNMLQGILMVGGTVDVFDSDFTGNGIGIRALGGVLHVFENVQFAENVDAGVKIAGSAGVDVYGCTFDGNDYGVWLDGWNASATIDSCEFDGNSTGVRASSTIGVVVSGNTFSNSTDEAIYCLSDTSITVVGNTISGGTFGMNLDASSPVIKDNVITGSGVGITADNGSEPVMTHCTPSGGSCPSDPESNCPNANDIIATSSHRVANFDAAVTIVAECNWWGKFHGGTTPSSGWFYGSVDYSPWLLDSHEPDPAPEAEKKQRLPTVYALSPNYPNPFNPTTTIAYQVPPPGGHVRIRIYNVRGQLVNTLVDDLTAPGYYDVIWRGNDNRGSTVASGVYFVQMLAPNFKQSRKVVILK